MMFETQCIEESNFVRSNRLFESDIIVSLMVDKKKLNRMLWCLQLHQSNLHVSSWSAAPHTNDCCRWSKTILASVDYLQSVSWKRLIIRQISEQAIVTTMHGERHKRSASPFERETEKEGHNPENQCGTSQTVVWHNYLMDRGCVVYSKQCFGM